MELLVNLKSNLRQIMWESECQSLIIHRRIIKKIDNKDYNFTPRELKEIEYSIKNYYGLD